MKTHTLLLAAAFIASSANAGTFVHEREHEFTCTADFNADSLPDIVIMDRATGMYRIGYGMAGNGALNWVGGRSIGAGNVDGMAVGPVYNTNNSIVVTAGDLNHLQTVSPASMDYVEARSMWPFGLGVRLPAVVNVPWSTPPVLNIVSGVVGFEDSNDFLLQFTAENFEGGFQPTEELNGNRTKQASSISLWSFTDTPTEYLATLHEVDHAESEGFPAYTDMTLSLYSLNGAQQQSRFAGGGILAGSRFVPSDLHQGKTDLFFYIPGQNDVRARRLFFNAQVNDLRLTSPSIFSTASGIEQVLVLDSTGPVKLALLLANHLVRIVTWDGDTNAWNVETTLTMAAGENLSGLAMVNGNRFIALSKSSGGTSSSQMEDWRFNNGSWQSSGLTSLPGLNATNRYANVLLMDSPPFRDEGSGVQRRYHARDWSTAASITGNAVNAEAANFGDPSTGIGTAVSMALGTTTIGSSQVAVPNQLHTQISMFSFTTELGDEAWEATVSPPSGTYTRGFRPTFDKIRFFWREGTSGGFQDGDGESPVPMPWINKNTVIQYYTRSDYPRRVSPLRTVTYTFTGSSALDSDDDGVTDDDELANGLDPLGGPDSDGDGFSDAEELRQGTNPSDYGDHAPAHEPALAFTVSCAAALLNLDGDVIDHQGGGTRVILSTVDGIELDSIGIGDQPTSDTLAYLHSGQVSAQEHFLVLRTSEPVTLLDSAPTLRRGREMIGIIPALEPVGQTFTLNAGAPGNVGFSWGSTNWRWEIAQASDLTLAAPQNQRAKVEITLSPDTTLAALLIEEVMHHLLREREAYSGARRFSITPAREIERTAPQAKVSREEIAALEHPDTAFPTASVVRPRTVLHHIDDAIAAPTTGMTYLIKLARDIYRLGQQPEGYGSPLDTLRQFIRTGVLADDYAASVSVPPAHQALAFAEITTLRNTLPERSTVPLTLTNLGLTNGVTTATNVSGTSSFYLLDDTHHSLLTGDAYTPDTRFNLTAYTDLPTINGTSALEVITTSVSLVPLRLGADSDGDLIADAWEMQHFGTLSHGGADLLNSGSHTLLQHYFDGFDPQQPPVNAGSRVQLELDKLELLFDANGQPYVKAEWPAAYARFVDVGFESSNDLLNFSNTGLGSETTPGKFRRNFTMSGDRGFFRAWVRLKQ